MTTVYQPPPEHNHMDHLSKFAELKDIDKIEKCTCGKYFYIYDVSYSRANMFNWRFYACWTYVRWYHLRKRKLIKDWEAKNDT